jgi:hypothetical protein
MDVPGRAAPPDDQRVRATFRPGHCACQAPAVAVSPPKLQCYAVRARPARARTPLQTCTDGCSTPGSGTPVLQQLTRRDT